MKVLISGGSGLIGQELVDRLRRHGNEVRTMVRDKAPSSESGIFWDVESGALDLEALRRWNGPDAVVHLAGESIGSGRWTREKKERIWRSRVDATARLSETLLRLGGVKVFVSASAIGIYGDRGDEILSESSAPGGGFLADVCAEWEDASRPLAREGVRVAQTRFGMILSGRGGALARMLPVFRWGLGGPVGNGRQWVSWVSLSDTVAAIEFVVTHPEIEGPVNIVAPNPVRNSEFASVLGAALHRPAVVPAAGFLLRLIFGELADELLLSSQRVEASQLSGTSFKFEHPTLREAFRAEI